MTSIYATSLSLSIQKSNFVAQKIDLLTSITYSMVLAWFSIQDKSERVRFFEETFLVTDISMELTLGMLFFYSATRISGFQKEVILPEKTTPI